MQAAEQQAHGIERLAKVVTGGGQKLALGGVGVFGLRLGDAKLLIGLQEWRLDASSSKVRSYTLVFKLHVQKTQLFLDVLALGNLMLQLKVLRRQPGAHRDTVRWALTCASTSAVSNGLVT